MITALSSFSGISVNDIQAAHDFYGETLALPVTQDAMGLHIELPGGGHLFVYEKPDHHPASFTVLNFVVSSIDDAIEHLAGHHGIVFERYDSLPARQDEKGILRGKKTGDGPDIAWFHDPAGNILSIIEE